MDKEGYHYILWDNWGGKLLILNSAPTAFNTATKTLTLFNGKPLKIDYSGYNGYLGIGNFTINTGPRVSAYASDSCANNEFLYSWTFTNQLTVWVNHSDTKTQNSFI